MQIVTNFPFNFYSKKSSSFKTENLQKMSHQLNYEIFIKHKI